MCGFAGFIGYSDFRTDQVESIASDMGDAIFHRGPDDFGIWNDNRSQVVLTHRRLSILDLSSAGHQPMVSASGRFVIAYNGEIYNHLEFRNKVQGSRLMANWKGGSDTEILLSLIETDGVVEALKQIVGMFAFALWDRKDSSLYLIRDRMGEKPLYFGWQKGVFLFGSELKALKVHPAFVGEVDRDSIALQLRHNCIPAPYSIYKGIKKLLPGTFLKLSVGNGGVLERKLPEPQKYWSFAAVVESGVENRFVGSESSAISELDNLLSRSVSKQMVADVPLGAFLSGGVDSSVVVALMQKQSSVPVKTFSIGFNERGYDEAIYAKEVANHLGTDHTELYVTVQQAMDVINRLPQLYDEPFSDSSQIPTFLVAEMTRQYVTVSLSGDGGDELFGGYNRYFKTHQWWDKINVIPKSVRRMLSKGLLSVPSWVWDSAGYVAAGLSGNNISKLAGVLSVEDGASLYRHFTTHWDDPAAVVIGGQEGRTEVTDPTIKLDAMVEQMMMLDTLTYLPDDILTKVDRAAMGVSLETRIPLLDHRVVEFAWKLPLSMKIRHGQGKWILRQLLYQYVPKELIERPKMGFGVPIDSWLRGPLREWAESLLDESRLRQEGYLYPQPIRKKWGEHLSGRRNWQHHLWDVLMFQTWLEAQS
jgi:asparagine synthase (glutamine-hydrolysing)